MSLTEDLSVVEDAAPHTLIPGPSLVLDSGQRALERLISRFVPENELVSLLEAIFSSSRATETLRGLDGSDAQTCIDAIDGVCNHALPSANNDLDEQSYILIGIGESRSLTAGPKEMCEVIIQDVCWPHPAS